MRQRHRLGSTILCLLAAGAMLLQLAGCGTKVQAQNLMEGVEAGGVSGRPADARFADSAADWAVRLFQQTAGEEKNTLVSPLSVLLALSMTANGAEGQTRSEMEALLGGGLPLEELNGYLRDYVKQLPSADTARLTVANSIWFRDAERLQVEPSFLQTNADYYGAAAYRAPFDSRTVQDINDWVNDATGGTIRQMLEEIPDEAVLYLINALIFDAEWEDIYAESAILPEQFTAADGTSREASMMYAEEDRYLDDGQAVGFIKPYKGGQYAFAALLPREDVSIDGYIASLTGQGLLDTLESAKPASVMAGVPKFQYESEWELNGALKTLGMPTAFDSRKADFSRMAHSSRGNIFIGEVIHKTFIAVDERGTKAGAATEVMMADEAAPANRYTVTLNRPFVYMILDTETNLPIFMGTVCDLL